MANTTLTGWGRGTWGQLTFGEPIPVVVTGVVGTTALDDGTAVQAAAVTGVSAVASASTLGDESVSCAANVTVTGNLGTSALNTVNVWGLVAQGISTTYTNVSTTQTPDWQEVSTTQTPDWQKVA